MDLLIIIFAAIVIYDVVSSKEFGEFIKNIEE